MNRYRVTITLDPPRGVVEDVQHDFVNIEIESTSRECITWLMKRLYDVTVSHDCIEEIEDKNE